MFLLYYSECGYSVDVSITAFFWQSYYRYFCLVLSPLGANSFCQYSELEMPHYSMQKYLLLQIDVSKSALDFRNLMFFVTIIWLAVLVVTRLLAQLVFIVCKLYLWLYFPDGGGFRG